MIKTVLALKHRQLPPSLHFSEANPEIDFPSTPFYVNTRLREWTSDGPQTSGRHVHRAWAERTRMSSSRKRPHRGASTHRQSSAPADSVGQDGDGSRSGDASFAGVPGPQRRREHGRCRLHACRSAARRFRTDGAWSVRTARTPSPPWVRKTRSESFPPRRTKRGAR